MEIHAHETVWSSLWKFPHSLLLRERVNVTIAVDDDVWMQFFYRSNAIPTIIIA